MLVFLSINHIAYQSPFFPVFIELSCFSWAFFFLPSLSILWFPRILFLIHLQNQNPDLQSIGPGFFLDYPIPDKRKGGWYPFYIILTFVIFLALFLGTYFPLLCLYLQSLWLYNTLSSGKVSISLPSLSFFSKIFLAIYHCLLLWQILV